jgi:hypothetical protein
MSDFYKTDDEITAAVRGFENCTTSKEAFNHKSHLTVATFYLVTAGTDEAFDLMCSGLLRFIEHHGVNPAKFNAALTRSWIEKVQEVIEKTPSPGSLVEITNRVIQQLAEERIAVRE